MCNYMFLIRYDIKYLNNNIIIKRVGLRELLKSGDVCQNGRSNSYVMKDGSIRCVS